MRSKIRTAKNKKSDMSIPMAVLKQSTDICFPSLTNLLNNTINDCHWPLELDSAIITPAHKKSSTTAKENYRPISVLPSVSKIFEKLLYDQLMEYMNDKTKHALVRMLERWKHCYQTLLMDLSKAYDCIPHDLLIAKLRAYGLNAVLHGALGWCPRAWSLMRGRGAAAVWHFRLGMSKHSLVTLGREENKFLTIFYSYNRLCPHIFRLLPVPSEIATQDGFN